MISSTCPFPASQYELGKVAQVYDRPIDPVCTNDASSSHYAQAYMQWQVFNTAMHTRTQVVGMKKKRVVCFNRRRRIYDMSWLQRFNLFALS